jgi:hypothetical protein
MSRNRVQDLHSLRLVCKLTHRRSFSVPSYPLLELATGVVEDFVGGSGSRHVSFRSLKSAFALHRETAAAEKAEADAAAAAAAEASAVAAAVAAVAADSEAEAEAVVAAFHF